MEYFLTDGQYDLLITKQSGDGGFQSLIKKLQNQCKTIENGYIITIDTEDKERINRYAHKYGNGGWEELLHDIFPDIC